MHRKAFLVWRHYDAIMTPKWNLVKRRGIRFLVLAMSQPIVRLPLRIRAGLKTKLAELAAKEHRSLNKQIEFLLERAVREESRGEVEDRRSMGRPASK